MVPVHEGRPLIFRMVDVLRAVVVWRIPGIADRQVKLTSFTEVGNDPAMFDPLRVSEEEGWYLLTAIPAAPIARRSGMA